MKSLRSILFVVTLIGLALFASALVFTSCQKDSDETSSKRREEFVYNQEVKLTDESGEYYIRAKVESNDKNALVNFLALRPSLRLIPVNTDETAGSSVNSTEVNSGGELDIPTDVFFSLTDKRNIPSGYSVEVFFQGEENPGAVSERGFSTYVFQDDIAKSVKTTVIGNYQMEWKYYSKGCCWYSVGYYYRGYITHYGPNYSYLFVANPTYSPYKGVKCKTTTTPQGITSTSRVYYY